MQSPTTTRRRSLLQLGGLSAVSTCTSTLTAALTAALTTALTAALPSTGFAQSWPTRPISLVVPFPAGGIVDNVSRALLPRLTSSLGQPLIIDNKAGAGGSIGTAQVAKARADGYTLLMAFDTHMVNPMLYTLTFDSEKDLTPVALIGTSPLIVLVPQSSPIQTLQDLVATAKKRPGALAYASTGPGSSNQLATELFKTASPPGAPQTEALLAAVPLQRVSEPVEIAHAIDFLLHPLAGYITGQTLHIDGGLTISATRL